MFFPGAQQPNTFGEEEKMDLSKIEAQYDFDRPRRMKRRTHVREMEHEDGGISWKKRFKKRTHRKKTWKDEFWEARGGDIELLS